MSRIGELLSIYLRFTGRGLRDVAKEIGTSKSTLSRITSGKSPDAETLMKLFIWMTR